TAKLTETKQSLIDNFGFKEEEILEISAKTGLGVDKVLEAIVERIPPPVKDDKNHIKAMVFSSMYDSHRGVIVFVRVFDGEISLENLRKNYTKLSLPPLEFAASKAQFLPVEIGVFHPAMSQTGILSAGEVGYIATGLKDITQARVGDTIIGTKSETIPFPGYKEPKSMVFLSFFPTENEDYLPLRESLEKLHLSDGSFTFKPHASLALGKGFLCGFLGLLHADIVKERLEREFSLNIITTAPTVEYEITLTNDETFKVRTPEDFPDPSRMKEVKEPIMYTTIYSPSSSVGGIMQLCKDKRGEYINLEYVGDQGKFTYLVPLSEMIVDFFDTLKSISSGYASLDYELYEMRVCEAVKLDIMLNHKVVDAFSQIVVREKVQFVAERLVNKLREVLPRQQFQIPIQAAIGGKVIARADVKSFRKDVTQKLYGGDRTRKDKLLEAQKKGKKRMRQFGDVEIPSEVFFQIYTQK
ncbi:MAG: Elongation factor 4, partial [Candidatus Gottesmanbacteria bacterium GW2011_GWC2_39_8]